jgi:phosphoesterase RecJ-like protein
MSYKAAQYLIETAEDVVLTTHINPDGDGIAASLALYHALKAMGKRVRFYCPSEVAEIYGFLPYFKQLKVVDDEQKARRLKATDLLISSDCGDLKRLGAVATMRHAALLNLDHHASNDRFGHCNVVDIKAASTGVVVEKLLKRLGVQLDQTIATCIYTTLVFDTGRFMHSNTTAAVFRLSAKLLDTGIDASAINRALSYTKRPIDLAVQRLGLEKLTVDTKESRIAGIALSVADRASLGEEVDDWGELKEIPRSLHGVEVAYLLREQKDGTVRASLRSNPPFEVGPIAQHFGGGGHLQAAGCTIEGDFAKVRRELLKHLRTIF